MVVSVGTGTGAAAGMATAPLAMKIAARTGYMETRNNNDPYEDLVKKFYPKNTFVL